MRAHGVLRAMAMAAALALAPGAAALEVSCSDGLDDDLDGLTDCADPECFSDAACARSAVRDLSVVREPGGRPWLNYFFVSWPERPDWADVASTIHAGDKCVGAPGGPAAGDGIVNADDLICTLWGGGDLATRAGAIQIQDVQGCTTTIRGAHLGPFGFSWYGTFVAPVDPRRGYVVQVSAPFGVSPANVVLLGGSCDPDWAPLPVERQGCEPEELERLVLQVPYDVLHASADEVLCGLEGADWQDGDGDGRPDTCPNGIFDGSTPVILSTFDNVALGDPLTDNAFVRRTVLLTDLGLDFLGDDFPLAPGEGYLVTVRSGHQPTVFDTLSAARCP